MKDTPDKVEISITDSGPGIDPKIQDKIFDPFFTTKDTGNGVGLGLSIARGIIYPHSGSLYFDPDSENTRFIFHLPKTSTLES